MGLFHPTGALIAGHYLVGLLLEHLGSTATLAVNRINPTLVALFV